MNDDDWRPIYYWRGYGWKAALISLLDWLDARVLGHRSHSVCEWIGLSPWWPSQPPTEAQDASRTHSTVPTETPRREPLSALQEALAYCPGLTPEEMREMHPECVEEEAQRPTRALVTGRANPLRARATINLEKYMLESPSAPINTLLTGSETTKQMLDRLTQEAEELGEYDLDCPGCGQPMSYHDDEGFVL